MLSKWFQKKNTIVSVAPAMLDEHTKLGQLIEQTLKGTARLKWQAGIGEWAEAKESYNKLRSYGRNS